MGFNCINTWDYCVVAVRATAVWDCSGRNTQTNTLACAGSTNAASARTQRKQRKQSRSGYFSARSRLIVVCCLLPGRGKKDFRQVPTQGFTRTADSWWQPAATAYTHTYQYIWGNTMQETDCACATQCSCSMAINAYLSALERVHGIIKMMKLILLSNQVFDYAPYTHTHSMGSLWGYPRRGARMPLRYCVLNAPKCTDNPLVEWIYLLHWYYSIHPPHLPRLEAQRVYVEEKFAPLSQAVWWTCNIVGEWSLW